MAPKYISWLILFFVFVVMLFGLWKINVSVPAPASGKIKVTTSFYPLYFFATEIAGDKLEVKNLTPAGVEPHDFEPTATDMVEIQQSKALILLGGSFEAWGEKIKGEMEGTGVEVFSVGESQMVNSDPHVWLSPEMAKGISKQILLALVKIDPTNESYYSQNLNSLMLKLEALQMDFKTGLAQCSKKDIVTSHSAFGYLAGEFGLQQVSISGLSPEEEPSTQDLIEVAKLAREKQVKYIFFETLVSPKLSETVAQEVGAKTLVLDPIEGISEEGLSGGNNYLTAMRENLSNLKIALECQ